MLLKKNNCSKNTCHKWLKYSSLTIFPSAQRATIIPASQKLYWGEGCWAKFRTLYEIPSISVACERAVKTQATLIFAPTLQNSRPDKPLNWWQLENNNGTGNGRRARFNISNAQCNRNRHICKRKRFVDDYAACVTPERTCCLSGRVKGLSCIIRLVSSLAIIQKASRKLAATSALYSFCGAR